MQHYHDVRRRILFSMILVPVVPFIMSMIIGYRSFVASLEESANTSMKTIALDRRDMISDYLAERRADLEFILKSIGPERMAEPGGLDAVFALLQKKSSAFTDLGLLTGTGRHAAYVGPYSLEDKDYSQSEWFRDVMDKGGYISDVFLGYRNVPHFVVAVRFESGGGNWILRATIDSTVFGRLVERISLGNTGEAYILNDKGELQTGRRSGGNLLDLDDYYYPKLDADVATFTDEENGLEYLYAFTRLNGVDWRLVVRQEKSDALSAVLRTSRVIIWVAVLGGVLIIALAFFLSGRIVNALKRKDYEKQSLSNQLVRATRLAELGEMSAGIAHEINNPLQIMKSDLTLMDMVMEDFEKKQGTESESVRELRESMDQLKIQINRCARITRSILKFGRHSEPERVAINLDSYLAEIKTLVEQKAAVSGIEFKCEVAEGSSNVKGDPGQLQQVFLNLLNNAIHAIEERHGSQGGSLSMCAGPGRDGMVEIKVIDNGAGISKKNLERIFTPFFTTKPTGQGTGLGLSVCYGIVAGMDGSMDVYSEEGVGCTFTVRLPVFDS